MHYRAQQNERQWSDMICLSASATATASASGRQGSAVSRLAYTRGGRQVAWPTHAARRVESSVQHSDIIAMGLKQSHMDVATSPQHNSLLPPSTRMYSEPVQCNVYNRTKEVLGSSFSRNVYYSDAFSRDGLSTEPVLAILHSLFKHSTMLAQLLKAP
jgi:hypothetical protein